MATFKTIVHKKNKDEFFHLIEVERHHVIGTSNIPHFYPVTADLEGALKYTGLSEDLKEYARQEYHMVLVEVTVYDGK